MGFFYLAIIISLYISTTDILFTFNSINMKISAKLFLISVLAILWFLFIPTDNYSVNAQLEGCEWFWANFEECWISDIQVPWTEDPNNVTWTSLIKTIKRFINRVLGILSLIALIILIRAGIKMLTAAWDDAKYKEWFKILKQVAFWLIFIWLARLMVSLIFWIIWLVTDDTWNSSNTSNVSSIIISLPA